MQVINTKIGKINVKYSSVLSILLLDIFFYIYYILGFFPLIINFNEFYLTIKVQLNIK